MCAAKNVLRVISPQRDWAGSPKLKHKIINQNSPLTHKNHNSAKFIRKSIENDFILTSNQTKNTLFPPKSPIYDISSPVTIHVSPSSPENEEKKPKLNTPSPSLLPKYLNLPNIGISKLPLSPTMFESCSPLMDSPHHRKSPKNEFLYTPDRNDLRLGQGSYGNVTLCKYGRRPFALKVVKCSKFSKLGEKNLIGVKHPHLVSVLKVHILKDNALIFMDFAGHSNLQQLLDNKADLAFNKKISFAQQIAAGLNHCHELKIVHGDVKPVNVIVNPKGVCKLGDFGLSVKVDPENEKVRANGLVGTAAYAAPEILKGFPLSLKADIYSFGITLWQLYTRETPFAGEHPHIVIYKVVQNNLRPVFENFNENNSILKEYSTLSIKCWDKNPELRPTSKHVLTSLTNLLNFKN